MNKKTFRSRGFTLIEVVIAIAIISLVAVGAMKLLIQADRLVMESRDTFKGTLAAERVAVGVLFEEWGDSGSKEEIGCKWEGSMKELEGSPVKYYNLKVIFNNREFSYIM